MHRSADGASIASMRLNGSNLRLTFDNGTEAVVRLNTLPAGSDFGIDDIRVIAA